MILLDTDILVDLLRRLPPAVHWFESLADEELVLPGYVVMELIQGCRSKAEAIFLQDQLRDMRVFWPDPETCERALLAYAEARFSHGLGLLDALIGSLALSLDAPLYTFNQKHYAGVPGLITCQPYEKV